MILQKTELNSSDKAKAGMFASCSLVAPDASSRATLPRSGRLGTQEAGRLLTKEFESKYRLLTEDQKKYLCAFALRVIEALPKDYPDMTTKPSTTHIRFVISGLSFFVKSGPNSELKEIPGLMGKVLLFALLQLWEGLPVLWLWGFRFCKRTQENRFVRLKSDIRREVAKAAPELDLHIAIVRGPHQLQSYQLRWNHGVSVCDPVRHAASMAKFAANDLRKKDFTTAFRRAVKAVTACSLYFPAYKICLDCLKQQPELVKEPMLKKHITTLMYASAEHEQWLEYLRDFNLEHIRKEFHEDIKECCIAQSAARLSAIHELRKRITDSESAAELSAWRNPANQVLNESREGTLTIERGRPVFKSDQAASDYQLLLDATRLYIEDSEQYENFKNTCGIVAASKLLEQHLVITVLIELAAHEKHYFFPEPPCELLNDAVDTATIKITGMELGKRVLKMALG